MANAIEQKVIDELAEDCRLLRKLVFEIPFMPKGTLEQLLSKSGNIFSYLARDGEVMYFDLTKTKERVDIGKQIIEAERKYGNG